MSGGVVGRRLPRHALARYLDEHGADSAFLAPLTSSEDESLYGLTVPGQDAVSIWHVLHLGVAETGYWPVILGGSADVEELLSNRAFAWEAAVPGLVTTPGSWRPARKSLATPVEAILREGLSLDPGQWMATRVARDPRYYDPPHGAWPEATPPPLRLTLPCNAEGGGYLPQVTVALIPTTDSWVVPAHLRWGGWNECPGPAEHVAMLRRWGDAYGAEVVGASPSVLELRVGAPPQSREDALRLAREQFVYCADIVLQGTETLEVLAALLLASTVWRFWWD